MFLLLLLLTLVTAVTNGVVIYDFYKLQTNGDKRDIITKVKDHTAFMRTHRPRQFKVLQICAKIGILSFFTWLFILTLYVWNL